MPLRLKPGNVYYFLSYEMPLFSGRKAVNNLMIKTYEEFGDKIIREKGDVPANYFIPKEYGLAFHKQEDRDSFESIITTFVENNNIVINYTKGTVIDGETYDIEQYRT